jgi:hypothetical protein
LRGTPLPEHGSELINGMAGNPPARPRFSAEVICELQHRIVAHREAAPHPELRPKFGEVKCCYKRWFGGTDPLQQTPDTIDAQRVRGGGLTTVEHDTVGIEVAIQVMVTSP